MDYNRIMVITDINSASGALRVQAGAIGAICSRNQGVVGVEFDDCQTAFVKPDGSGRLIQDAPYVYTTPAKQ